MNRKVADGTPRDDTSSARRSISPHASSPARPYWVAKSIVAANHRTYATPTTAPGTQAAPRAPKVLVATPASGLLDVAPHIAGA